uniref:Uncharacterized protein n=1 Tax=Bicosoecida sp. CB-2014 TaxID=1486930 RepID=A0A7S1CF73_9STRA
MSASSSYGSAISASAAVPSERERERRRLGGRSAGFMARQEAALLRSGRANATSLSRVEEPLEEVEVDDDDDDDVGDDVGELSDDGRSGRSGGGGGGGSSRLRGRGAGAASVASRASRASYAPSLHPSVAGHTVVSMACSEATIGAGDATGYWDFAHRSVERSDLGHRCRECKMPFTAIGEPLTERRGARVSMRYHAECFSGYADPRSQAGSSHHVGHLAGSQLAAAPSDKAGSKMRTTQHFDGQRGVSARRDVAAATGRSGGVGGAGGGGVVAVGSDRMSGAAGKIAGFGSNSFGARSAKGTGMAAAAAAESGGGGLTEAQLRAHERRMDALPEEREGDDGESKS